MLGLSSQHKSIMVTLLLSVDDEPKDIPWKGGQIRLFSGEIVISLEKLAKLSGSDVNIRDVKSFLDQQAIFGFLTYKSTSLGHLISIAKWEQYDSELTLLDAAEREELEAEYEGRPLNWQFSLTYSRNGEIQTESVEGEF